MKRKIEPKYMMGTTAIHCTGDISREVPDLCVVFEEDDDNYYGNWSSGFGFVDVRFPKDTTRELTPEEVANYHGQIVTMNGEVLYAINITGENFHQDVIITKKQDGKIVEGTLIAPLKVGSVIALVNFKTNKTFRSSRIRSVNGNEVQTLNSTYVIQYVC